MYTAQNHMFLQLGCFPAGKLRCNVITYTERENDLLCEVPSDPLHI